MKIIYLIACLILMPHILFSQGYGRQFNQTVAVNSATSLNGYTRNKIEVTLPGNTIGYILRISTFKKGYSKESSDLFSLLEKIPASEIALGASVAQFAIANNDGNNIDAFIFSNMYDADNFYAKEDGKWSSCKDMHNMVNTCFYENSCLNRTVYFGFRNNNIREGLDVHLEIVPVIDNGQNKSCYTYSINNTTDKELKYFISVDKIKWESVSLHAGYLHNHTIKQPYLFFRIVTNDKPIEYKITPDQRHKIIWNATKNAWDLVHY